MGEHLVDALLCICGRCNILKGDYIDVVKEAGSEGWCFPITV
ncbi:hypothetical protein [Sulfurimonas sp. HSL3-7]